MSFNIGLITCSSQGNKCFEVIVLIFLTDCQRGVGYVSSFSRVCLRVFEQSQALGNAENPRNCSSVLSKCLPWNRQ